MAMLLRTIFAAVLLGLGGAAHAFVPPTINIAPPFAMGKLQQELLKRRMEEREPRRQGEQAAPVASRARFTFTPSRSRTQANVRNFVARTPHPAARAELEQMFAAQPGLMDDLASGARAYGFDPHNIADAYALWWMNAWDTSEKRDSKPDAATVAAVKQQVYAAFAATPDFGATSDSAKQEFAEALLLQAALLGSAFEQNRSNPEMLELLAEAARKGAKASYGIDLRAMTLTRDGFVPREAK
jgi:hypothetical protein